jgi:hypothetical protein
MAEARRETAVRTHNVDFVRGATLMMHLYRRRAGRLPSRCSFGSSARMWSCPRIPGGPNFSVGISTETF